VYLRLCVGVLSSFGASRARAPMRSKVDPAAIVAVGFPFCPDLEILDAGDLDGDSEKMRRRACASSEALPGDNGGR